MKNVESKAGRHNHGQKETNPQAGVDAEEPVPEIAHQTLAALVGRRDEIPAYYKENRHAWKILKDQRPRGRVYFEVEYCVKVKHLRRCKDPE